jgi:hypothetical protein
METRWEDKNYDPRTVRHHLWPGLLPMPKMAGTR